MIALAGAGTAYYFIQKNRNSNKNPSIDQIIQDSVDLTDFTTNLAGGNYIKMSFKIQTNSKAAAAELTKREFQVQNILIQDLSDIKASDLEGKAGKIKLEDALKQQINEVMQDGKVVQVYITNSLLQ